MRIYSLLPKATFPRYYVSIIYISVFSTHPNIYMVSWGNWKRIFQFHFQWTFSTRKIKLFGKTKILCYSLVNWHYETFFLYPFAVTGSEKKKLFQTSLKILNNPAFGVIGNARGVIENSSSYRLGFDLRIQWSNWKKKDLFQLHFVFY